MEQAGPRWGPACLSFSLCAVELVVETVVDHLYRPVRVADVDQHGNLNLAGGDHIDIDTRAEQRLEHGGGHAGVVDHACTHDGYLGDIVRHVDVVEVDAVPVLLQQPLFRCGRWTEG